MRHPNSRGPAALILMACALAGCQSPSNRAVVADAPRTLSPGAPSASAAEPRGPMGQATTSVSKAQPGASGPASTPRGPSGTPAAMAKAQRTDGSSDASPEGRPTGPAGGAAVETGPDASVAWPRTVDGSSDLAVARVGGQDVALTDLVSKWIMRDPNGVRAILDDLIISRIVVLESATFGIELPSGTVEKEVGSRLRALESSAQKAGAPTLEVYIQKRLGLNQQTFLRELEREAAVDLLAPRCIRAWLMGSDRREIRAITVKDQAGCDLVEARLARGEAFEDVAKELSTDRSAKDGGRMPPVVRGDQPLSRTAFAAQVGSVSGPIQDEKGFVFLLVESAPAGQTGPWDVIGKAVEGSLSAQGIEDPEFWQWKDAMFQRYDIDLTPFLELARR